MRALREETKPQSWGNGPGKKSEDDFGGGSGHGDPFEDGEVTTESDEVDLTQLQNRRKKDEKGNKVADGHASMAENRTARLNGKLKNEQAEARKLRTQLAASNLLNVKLAYTNKLLQLESLTKRQKAAIVERLEEATTLRDVKLVYEGLTKALKKRSLQESVTVRAHGSSSSVTATTGAPGVVTEGYETRRWAQLAGLDSKKND
jgi:hypothetical protein